MAQQEGIIKFSGKLDDLVAYKLNGKWVIRKNGKVSKERYKKDKSFDLMRRTNKEFGGASTYAKEIRKPWRKYIMKCKDNTLHYRMNSFILELIKAGSGQFGKRTINWDNIYEMMPSFIINKANPLSHYINNSGELNVNNGTLSWTLTNIDISKAPPGSTHFQLLTLIDELPELSFSNSSDAYQMSNVTSNTIELTSDISGIEDSLNYFVSHIFNTPNKFWTVTRGIIFYQKVNDQFFELNEMPLEWQQVLKT